MRFNLSLTIAACAALFWLHPCPSYAALVPLPADNTTEDEINEILSSVTHSFNARLVYQALARFTDTPPTQTVYSVQSTSNLLDLVKDGMLKMEQKNFAEAIIAFSEVIKSTPQFEDLHYSLGTALLFSGRDQEAEKVLRLAIRIVPWRSKTWAALAISLANQGKQDAGASALFMAYEFSVNKPETFAMFKNQAEHSKSDALRALYKSVLPRIEQRAAELDRLKKEREIQKTAAKDAQTPTVPDQAGATPSFLSGTCKTPAYPVTSMIHNEKGTVTLVFLTDKDGQFVDAIIEKSSGYVNLDYAAQLALSRCRMKPSVDEKVPVKPWKKIQFVWKLE